MILPRNVDKKVAHVVRRRETVGGKPAGGNQGRTSGRLRGDLPHEPGRPGGVLAGGGRSDRLGAGARPRARRHPAPVLPMVPRRRAQHLSQRPGPARGRRARRPDGPGVRLRVHQDEGPLLLRRAARPGRDVRRRAARARRGRRRPGGDLHADGPAGGCGDAGLRAARRGALGGVRRLRAQGARRAHRRRPAVGGRVRLVRDRAGQGRGVQADRGRGAAPVRAPPRARRGLPARAGPRLDGGARRGWRRGDAPRGPRRMRPGRGDRPALHPLHLRHHRQAQGRGARQRRARGGAGLVHAEHLRRRPRRTRR
jgi:hypothetical protein